MNENHWFENSLCNETLALESSKRGLIGTSHHMKEK